MPERLRPPVARSTAMTYGTNVAVAGLSFVSVVITSRALGPQGRGEVAFLTTVGYLTAQLATLGIQQAIANLAGRRPALSPTLAGNGLVLSAALGGLAVGVVGVLFAAVPAAGGDAAGWQQALVLATVPVIVLQVCLQFLAQAHYLFGVSNLAWVLAPAVMVVANGVLGSLGALTVGTAVAAWCAGQVLATAVLVRATVGVGGFGRPDGRLARSMVAFGAKAHLGRVMLLGNYRLDQWLLGGLAGARQLGPYSVAVAWSEVLFFLPTALTAVQRPDLVRAGPEEARRQAARAFRMTVLVTVPMAVVLVVAAPVLCVTVFGGGFRDAVPELRVLALGGPGIVALKLFGNALTAQRAPLRETAAIAVAFAAIVTLDLALIPAHGGMGAAVASTVAYTLGGVAAAVVFLRSLGGRAAELVPGAGDARALADQLRTVRRRLAPAAGDRAATGDRGAAGDRAATGDQGSAGAPGGPG